MYALEQFLKRRTAPQPQQPAVEPVAWVNQANLASASIERTRCGQGDTHTWSETRTTYHSVPLYTAPQPAKQEHPVTFTQVAAILDGIDRTVCQDDAGWWATSAGSDFGSEKLDELRKLFGSEQPAMPTSPTLTRDEVRELFVSNGFTVKPGEPDLKPYVYKAAAAIIDATRQKVGLK